MLDMSTAREIIRLSRRRALGLSYFTASGTSFARELYRARRRVDFFIARRDNEIDTPGGFEKERPETTLSVSISSRAALRNFFTSNFVRIRLRNFRCTDCAQRGEYSMGVYFIRARFHTVRY